MKIEDIDIRSLITKSKVPGIDYVVNPYIGCQFGCSYCYASFMGRFANESILDWGTYVYIKKNAVEHFEKELQVLLRKTPTARLLLSSVTDPYHAPESKYQLTRGILSVLVRYAYSGQVTILTKSPSVLRDIDLLKNLKNVEVGLTITTTDDLLARVLEGQAPRASKRIQALKELKANGIKTFTFVGPLLPHFRYQPELLDHLFQEVSSADVDSVFVEHLNMSPYIKMRLMEKLKGLPEEFLSPYKDASLTEHLNALDTLVLKLVEKYGISLRLKRIIRHVQDKKDQRATKEKNAPKEITLFDLL